MKKSDKPLFVDSLSNLLQGAKSLVLVDPSNIPVKQQVILRSRLKDVGGTVLVAKNTLLERALRKVTVYSEQVTELKQALIGQTAIIIAKDDELAPLQILGKFIKEFELPRLKVGVVGGITHNSQALLALSRLPGREIIAGQALGALVAPLYGIVGVLQGKMQELVYILDTKSKALSSKQ